MADNRLCSKIVTEFLVDTCLHEQLNIDKIITVEIGSAHPKHDDDKVVRIPLLTGSVAEFYIQPMLTCVGDIDMMYHSNSNVDISTSRVS